MKTVTSLLLLSTFTASTLTLTARATEQGGGVPVLPCPLGPEADLWVLAGQSNMQGCGLITRTYPANPKIMMLDLSNEWMPAVPPIHRVYTAAAPVYRNTVLQKNPTLTVEAWDKIVADARKKPSGGVGLELSFAVSMVGATGRPVGLIPCALGSTAMADWDPAGLAKGELSLYGNMVRRIRMAGGKIKGLLWYQGESDAAVSTVGQFQAAFLNFVDCLRRDTGIADLPVIYVQISRVCMENQTGAPEWEQVRELQRTLAAQRRNLWVVPAIDLPLDDLIHVGEAGHERLGRRVAEVALTHLYHLPGHGTPIDFKSCEILPPLDVLHHRLRVTFSGVTGRIQAQGRPAGFELRSDDPKKDGPMVFKVEPDPEHPDAVIVWYSKAIEAPVRLYYGAGLNPYANLTDSLDMAVPAFGPIKIDPKSAP
ncbi:MAG: sialate O-acetylesterase [Opitutae bacterium]|nr:sialate O-acetylesterase [Opitutae bacterium]